MVAWKDYMLDLMYSGLLFTISPLLPEYQDQIISKFMYIEAVATCLVIFAGHLVIWFISYRSKDMFA